MRKPQRTIRQDGHVRHQAVFDDELWFDDSVDGDGEPDTDGRSGWNFDVEAVPGVSTPASPTPRQRLDTIGDTHMTSWKSRFAALSKADLDGNLRNVGHLQLPPAARWSSSKPDGIVDLFSDSSLSVTSAAWLATEASSTPWGRGTRRRVPVPQQRQGVIADVIFSARFQPPSIFMVHEALTRWPPTSSNKDDPAVFEESTGPSALEITADAPLEGSKRQHRRGR